MTSYLFALAANLCFSSATIVFSQMIPRTSILWVNAFKALVATLACGIGLVWANPQLSVLSFQSLVLFLTSGLVGLNFADIFLLGAFVRLGPARTLLMYGFQPFFLSLGGYFALGQPLSIEMIAGVSLMFLCLICVSYEKYRQAGRWEFKGLFLALSGVFLDASGVLMSRMGMEGAEELPTLVPHFFRSVGALGGFLFIGLFVPLRVVELWRGLTRNERFWITAASFWGTFLSLWLWLTAIRSGHLGSLASISMTGPFFAGVFEHILQRRLPNLIYLFAFIFFASGFMLLIRS